MKKGVNRVLMEVCNVTVEVWFGGNVLCPLFTSSLLSTFIRNCILPSGWTTAWNGQHVPRWAFLVAAPCNLLGLPAFLQWLLPAGATTAGVVTMQGVMRSGGTRQAVSAEEEEAPPFPTNA